VTKAAAGEGSVVMHSITLSIPLYMYATCLAWPIIVKARSAHEDSDCRLRDVLTRQ